MARTLYIGTRNASSWAMRAWLALKEAGVAFDEVEVDIRMPQRLQNLARIAALAPPAAVPVLVDGDAVVYDSLAIMEYANDLCGGGLLPDDVMQRAQARALLAWQHAGLSGLCPRLSFESTFYPKRRAMTAVEQEQAGRIFAAWEQAMVRSGGPWLMGALSLADLAFVPTVVRLLAHTAMPTDFPLADAWSQHLLARASVQAWMQAARGLPPVLLDDYLPA